MTLNPTQKYAETPGMVFDVPAATMTSVLESSLSSTLRVSGQDDGKDSMHSQYEHSTKKESGVVI